MSDALLDEWIAHSARQWSAIVALTEEIIDLKLELELADARLTVMRGELLLAQHPVPHRMSRFEEMALDESDPFG